MSALPDVDFSTPAGLRTLRDAASAVVVAATVSPMRPYEGRLGDPEVIRELVQVSAEELHLHAGFQAVAGFPLPSGLLPVGTAGLGVVLVSIPEWDRYRALCAAERAQAAAHYDAPASL